MRFPLAAGAGLSVQMALTHLFLQTLDEEGAEVLLLPSFYGKETEAENDYVTGSGLLGE